LEEVFDRAETNSGREKENLDSDYKLWVQAIRYKRTPPPIELVLQRIRNWQHATDSLEANYYLFVLNTLLVLQGMMIPLFSLVLFWSSSSLSLNQ